MAKKFVKILEKHVDGPAVLVDKAKRLQPFKLALESKLDRQFDFKKLKTQDIREFDRFLTKTIGRRLTVTEVETLFLRTTGPHGAKHFEQVNGIAQIVFHFSNGTRDFRVHGYYNQLGYLVVIRIDPHHNYQF